ncbi:iron ABC transporter permease [Arachnia propionica]|uniref:FecCD family ABC transporter permease n=1 Tax=Arachnia propionica TaxID=1750 RepID=UPI00398FDCAE
MFRTARFRSRVGVGLRLVVLALALLLTPALTVVIGAAAVPLDEVIGVLASHIPGLDVQITWDRSIDAIVWDTRLPRIIAGVAVAVILGVSGVVLQAVVRNALAEPYVLGVSAGASSGAAFAIIIVGTSVATVVGVMAFAGALLATLLVLAIAGRTQSPLQLILGGLGVGFGFQALTNLIIFSSDSPETARSVMFWTLGSLARAGWDSVPVITIAALLLTVLMVLCGPILDALASGDRTAQAVGVEPARARILLLIPVSAAIALAVATAGGIGFVGLVVPHLVRSFIGPSHRFLVLGSALAAGLFLVWADAFARLAFAPAEVPIGVVTGLVGAPWLVLLVRRQGHSL